MPKKRPNFPGLQPLPRVKIVCIRDLLHNPRRLKPTLVVAASGTDESVPFRKIQDAAHKRRQEKCRAKARRYNPCSRHSDPAARRRNLLLIGHTVSTIYPSPAHKPLAPLFATPHIIHKPGGAELLFSSGISFRAGLH